MAFEKINKDEGLVLESRPSAAQEAGIYILQTKSCCWGIVCIALCL